MDKSMAYRSEPVGLPTEILPYTNRWWRRPEPPKQAEVNQDVQAQTEPWDGDFNALPAAIAAFDADERYLRVNPRYAKLFGRTVRETEGQGVRDVIGDANYARIKPLLARVIAGEAVSYERDETDANGQTRTLAVFLQPDTHAGEPSHLGVLADVTELRKTKGQAVHPDARSAYLALSLSNLQKQEFEGTEQFLHAATELGARALAIETVALWRFNPERDALVCLDWFNLSTGVHRRGMVQKVADHPWFFEALSRERFVAVKDLRHDPRVGQEACAKFAAKGVVAMLSSAMSVGGKVQGVLGFSHSGAPRSWSESERAFGQALASLVMTALLDADHRGALEAQKDSARQFQNLLDAMPDRAWMKDAQGHYLAVNAREAQHLGLPGAQIVGHTITELRPGFSATQREVEDLQVMGEDGPSKIELHSRTTGVWSEVLKSAVRGQDGAVVGVAGISRDISDRKRTEQALQVALAQALVASQNKSQFLAAMSHEIRSPLNAVLGLNHLALQRASSPEMKALLEKIQTAGQSLLALTNGILDLSKIEAGQLQIEEADFDLHELLDGVASTEAMKAHQKGLDFELEKADQLPRQLRGDALRLRQVIVNLVGNAIKFTAQGRVSLGVSHQTQGDGSLRLECTVQDSGIGISQEQEDSLFLPYTQAHVSTTRQHGGTGLGLSISRQLVELMGGRLSVTSLPGRGSRFSFSVCCGAVQGAEMQEPLLAKEGASADAIALAHRAPDLRGARILLVEDDAVNQEVALGLLQPTGATVVVAHNGQEALALAVPGAFDLILMDTHMPVMGGAEATAQLRANPALAALPIIAMTASAMSSDRARLLAVGVTDYITKPVHVQAFHEMLGRHLKNFAHR